MVVGMGMMGAVRGGGRVREGTKERGGRPPEGDAVAALFFFFSFSFSSFFRVWFSFTIALVDGFSVGGTEDGSDARSGGGEENGVGCEKRVVSKT